MITERERRLMRVIEALQKPRTTAEIERALDLKEEELRQQRRNERTRQERTDG